VGVGLAVIGLSLLVVAAGSRYLSGTPVTPAMLVVAIGVIFGPLMLDRVSVPPTSSTVRSLAEATLAVVLFSDSSRVNLHALRRELSMPSRLLGIGLPLTILAGGLTAIALFGSLSISEAMIIGVVLAPTDAGLGSAVVTDERLPQIVRQSLNVESGLNDGICVPLLLILLATTAGSMTHPARVVAEEIGYGLLFGVGAALLAAVIVRTAGRHHLIDEKWEQVLPVATTLAAYGAATALNGSGFIAAFAAGATFGLLVRETDRLMRFTEETGLALDSVTFLIFGAVLLGPSLEHVGWRMVLYAIVSLTIVRMVPVALSLIGSHARVVTVTFLGWFGPRGLASVVFAVIVEDAGIPHASAIVSTVYLTVGLSVLAHGVSAAPLVDRYVRWYRRATTTGSAVMESTPAHEHRVALKSAARRGSRLLDSTR
jgi:NhaP-type Na+/H+ or K+/H+ antiporter